MKNAFVWLLLLWKRLFKKKGFLITLALIPILGLLMSMSQGGEKGFVHIAIATEGEADSVACELIDRLQAESELIAFHLYESKEAAVKELESGKADAAWIIPGGLDERLEDAATNKDIALAEVYQREDNVLLKMTREKIFCTLFPELSYKLYRNYLTEKMLPEAELGEDEIYEAYRLYATDEGILELEASQESGGKQTDYLLSPLRGIFAILLLFCGLASTLYFLSDEENGTFVTVAGQKRFYILWAGNLCALVTGGVFMEAALLLSGLYTDFARETLSLILLILCCNSFCCLLGSLIKRTEVFSLLLPLTVILTVVISPIFVNLLPGSPLPRILPVTDYLYFATSGERSVAMVIYAAAGFHSGRLIYMLRKG